MGGPSAAYSRNDAARATAPGDVIVPGHDLCPWASEHLFAVDNALPDEKIVTLSGDFITKLFDGHCRNAKEWHSIMQGLANTTGTPQEGICFHYFTGPECAKAYG